MGCVSKRICQLFQQQKFIEKLRFNSIYEILRVNDESLLNNETQLKPSQMDKYAQKVVNEILSLCINNKVNQEDILLQL